MCVCVYVCTYHVCSRIDGNNFLESSINSMGSRCRRGLPLKCAKNPLTAICNTSHTHITTHTSTHTSTHTHHTHITHHTHTHTHHTHTFNALMTLSVKSTRAEGSNLPVCVYVCMYVCARMYERERNNPKNISAKSTYHTRTHTHKSYI